MDNFASSVIGVPFKPHGRDRDGLDCWGLVCLAYRELKGVELDDYSSEYRTLKDFDRLRTIFQRECGTTWRKVDKPEPLDVAVIYRRARPIHAGIYIGNGRILHVEHGIETTVQHESEFKIEGYYRPCA